MYFRTWYLSPVPSRDLSLPVRIVTPGVVAPQGCQSPQAYRVREEDLCPSVYPHLARDRQTTLIIYTYRYKTYIVDVVCMLHNWPRWLSNAFLNVQYGKEKGLFTKFQVWPNTSDADD